MEFEPQQSIEVPPDRRMPWKVIAIAGGVLLVVAITIGIILFMRGRGDRLAEERQRERLAGEVEASLTVCANASDPDACRQERVSKAAVASGTVSVCKLLTAEAYDACVWDTARTQQKPDLCASIQDGGHALRCADDLYVQSALESGNPAACENVRDTTSRERCRETLRGPATSADCLERGLDEDYCAELAMFEQALMQQSLDACGQLTIGDFSSDCRNILRSLDRDTDGLSAGEEADLGTDDRSVDSDADGLSDGDEVRIFETDPLDPDTDGDGFTDGDEVAAGYNPNGPGRLE